MRVILVFAILAAASSWALADFSGRVVRVADGDTLTVLVKNKQIRIRLESIDAPESKQPFGKRSQQSLAELCAAKTAIVVSSGKDTYGRTLGWVLCDGIEANSEQVRRGMAWVFVKHAPRNSPLYAIQSSAQQLRLGLWADPRPTPPWEWRALKRVRY
jgi:endonuclease YncB( thermonuclease family)